MKKSKMILKLEVANYDFKMRWSQFATTSKYSLFAFTEQGVAMLSNVLKSNRAKVGREWRSQSVTSNFLNK